MTHLDKILNLFPLISKDNILLVIETDLDGKILDWSLNEDKKTTYQLVAGSILSDYFLFLEGIFDCDEDELVLPNMQIGESIWMNIYIKKIASSLLIGFEDNSDSVHKMRDKIQNTNEKELNK